MQGSASPDPLHPSGCPVRAVPRGAGPLCPGGGRAGTAGERLRGGCAGLTRGPGLLSGSWHCPTPAPARKQRLSLRGRTEVSPHHPTHSPTCGAGSLGRNENARELCKTPPGLSGEPGRAEMRVLPVPEEPQMRFSRTGSPDPAVPACHRHLPAVPAAPGARQVPRCPPGAPAAVPGRPRHRPPGPAGFAPFPERCRAAPREFRLVGAGKLPRAGSLRSLPGGERLPPGMRGRFRHIHGHKQRFKFGDMFFRIEGRN